MKKSTVIKDIAGDAEVFHIDYVTDASKILWAQFQ